MLTPARCAHARRAGRLSAQAQFLRALSCIDSRAPLKRIFIVLSASVVAVLALAAWLQREPAVPAAEAQARAPALPDAGAPAVAVALAPSAVVLPPLDCASSAGGPVEVLKVGETSFSRQTICGELQALAGPQPPPPAPGWHAQARLLRERRIDGELVHQALARAGTPVTEAELDGAAAQALRGKVLPASDGALLREQLRGRLELARLLAGRKGPPLSEADLRAAYELDPQRHGEPAMVLAEPFVARRGGTADEAQTDAAREKAEDFFGEVSTGAAPAEAARRWGLVSLAPFELRAGGGEPELETEVLGTSSGQWARPVRTRVGWVVLRVIERRPARVLPFEQARERMRATALGAWELEEKRRLLQELRAASRVEDFVSW